MVDVYNAAKEKTGEYSKDRVVGSETFRILQAGVREGARDLAIARGNWVDYAITLADVDVLTTDAIRYALDEFRELEPEDEVPADRMRGVVEYLRRTSLALKADVVTGSSGAEVGDGVPAVLTGGVVLATYNGPADPQARAQALARAEDLWLGLREFQNSATRASEVEEFMQRWEAKWGTTNPQDSDPPVTYGETLESDKPVAIFVSDLHMSDASEGGDDFMTPHLAVQGNGLVAGNPGPRASKVAQFGQMVAWIKQRVRQVFNRDVPFDLVLNGDVYDQLEMIGRGTQVGAAHQALVAICAGLQQEGCTVVYLRGNHDFNPPPGPWIIAEAYSNGRLKVFAEHGDQYDPSNWPPGTNSFGAKVVTGGLSAGVPALASLEVLRSSLSSGPSRFWLAGVDNVRPFADIGTMLSQRSSLGLLATIQDPVGLGLQIANALSTFDSTADQKGAARRRKVLGSDWLVVQGHTHVPVSIPGRFYNTGTWAPVMKVLKSVESCWYFWTESRPRGREDFVSVDPFLLTYESPGDKSRIEEYYTILRNAAGIGIEQRTAEQINALFMSIYADASGTAMSIIPELQGP